MIIHECKQGSPEWNELRRGKPTASEFEKLVTPTGRASTSRTGYLCKKLAERFGFELDAVSTAGLTWGHEMEPTAAETYAMIHGVDIQVVGFCTTDDGQIGASPDRLVGDDGLLQIKCPYTAHTHLGYLVSPKHEALIQAHYPQVQGEMLVTGRRWCDLVSYYPGLPTITVRVGWDELYQRTLDQALRLFCADLDRVEKEIRGTVGFVEAA